MIPIRSCSLPLLQMRDIEYCADTFSNKKSYQKTLSAQKSFCDQSVVKAKFCPEISTHLVNLLGRRVAKCAITRFI